MLWFDDSMSHGHSGARSTFYNIVMSLWATNIIYNLYKDTFSSSSIHILSGRGSSPFTEVINESNHIVVGGAVVGGIAGMTRSCQRTQAESYHQSDSRPTLCIRSVEMSRGVVRAMI
jgi:hypothetical protein